MKSTSKQTTLTTLDTAPQQQTTALIETHALQQIVKIDETIRDARRGIAEAEERGTAMAKALILAKAVSRLRQQLTPALMQDVLSLRGTDMGFRTDRDQRPPAEQYTPEVIRDALISAMLQGFRPTNGEVVIISASPYVTGRGLMRAIREFSGLTALKIQLGVPTMTKDGRGALAYAKAEWKLHGIPDQIVCDNVANGPDCRIACRVNSSMGIDGVLGKVRAKLYKRIHERLTGSDVDVVEAAQDDDHDTAPGAHLVANGPVIECPFEPANETPPPPAAGPTPEAETLHTNEA